MTKVYEQLAQQLVVEQAELMQKEVVVSGLKKAIAEKKLNIVRDCINGALFKIEGKKVAVLKLSSSYSDDEMSFGVTFGIDPKSITLDESKLTKKEKELWQQYKDSFVNCKWNWCEDERQKALDAAHHLDSLKHKIHLWIPFYWRFSYDDALKPGFFKNTGLGINDFHGLNPEPLMLEEVKYGRCKM